MGICLGIENWDKTLLYPLALSSSFSLKDSAAPYQALIQTQLGALIGGRPASGYLDMSYGGLLAQVSLGLKRKIAKKYALAIQANYRLQGFNTSYRRVINPSIYNEKKYYNTYFHLLGIGVSLVYN